VIIEKRFIRHDRDINFKANAGYQPGNAGRGKNFKIAGPVICLTI
jgi:hypothetical protein